MDKEKDIGKLGTILAIHSDIIRNQNEMFGETLEMLKEQQKRQVRMIWSSIGIVALAMMLCGLACYMIMASVQGISNQIESHNKVMEAVLNASAQGNSENTTQKSTEN